MNIRLLIFLLAAWLLPAQETVPGRYIVELEGEPAAARMMAAGGKTPAIRSAAAGQRLAEIRAQHRRMRPLIEQAQGQVTGSLETVANALLVRIPDAGAARLASIPGVRRVHQARKMYLLLDHALPLHRVPEVWARIGQENAGRGIKIGIIDTGIDISHPGMQDASLPVPEGFPKVNDESDIRYTNSKVIVARSYARQFSNQNDDLSARDNVGHGTGTAMAAAGAPATGPLAAISGVAPKAYLGNYKVFGTSGVNESTSTDIIISAIEDAVEDGMDVINLSLGSSLAPRLEDDLEAQALERAAQLGVVVVVAAGNTGPDPATVGSPGTAPSVITVGAVYNDRAFAASAEVDGGAVYRAVPGNGPRPPTPVTAPLVDVAALDGNGLACAPLPAGSLTARMAFILRGDCTFETKLNNAAAAGAAAALVYTHAAEPDPITMMVGSSTLPASMIGYPAGLDVKYRLSLQPLLNGTLFFTSRAVPSGQSGLAPFSSRGPSVDLQIKPDLVAAGTSIYTATEAVESRGRLYDPSGFNQVQGTSFSAPIVAGAAAVLKAARPGLTAAQYRSLLINSATPVAAPLASRNQAAGAGSLNLDAAIQSTAAVQPVSLGFGSGGPDPALTREFMLTNVGSGADLFSIGAIPNNEGPWPGVSTTEVWLEPGASTRITVSYAAQSLPPGPWDGFVIIRAMTSGVETRIPYWYARTPDAPRRITILMTAADNSNPRPGASLSAAALFRITDASGVPLTDLDPQVTVVSGGGTVLRVVSRDRSFPGVYSFSAQLGPLAGPNVFRITAGDLSREVTIESR
ncbi:MAG: S8 family serine peptidase [Bryobacterales bacterium]|nr:S8 family serine peptidase [Bryobacterales bacterium]